MNRRPHVQFFSSDGQGGGTVNMAVDGSGATQTFQVAVPTGFSRFFIARVIWEVVDSGTFDATDFGNGLTLSEGIGLTYESAGFSIDLLGAQKITSNADFGRVAYDVDVKTWGTGDEVLLSRLSFNKFAGPDGVQLDGADTLDLTVDDDLTGLTSFTALAQGRIE